MATAEVAPAYAPEDPTLPKPWTGLIDGGTGVLYYWNPETNATQYEKPAPLAPPMSTGSLPAATPRLAPIPVARSLPPSNNLQHHEAGRQQQPMQMQNPQAQQYHMNQYMRDQPMSRPQGQQQMGPPVGHQQGQRVPVEGERRWQEENHMGFSAPSGQQIMAPVAREGNYSVPSHQQIGGPSAVSAQHAGAGVDAIRWQQPMNGPAGATQMGHGLNQPHMGPKMGYADQHGRDRNEYHSAMNKGGPMVPHEQPKSASTPHAGNWQDTRMSASDTQSIVPSRPGGLNMTPEFGMPKIHDRAAFASVTPRGPSPRMLGSSDFANISASDAYCQEHEISVMGDNVPAPFISFEATGFPPEILREIHSAGFRSPTPIQAQTWPVALQSRDIVAIAKTGSGKTLGYLIPAFSHLKQCRNNPQIGPTVVVLSPTRELATQIQEEAIKFGRSSRISCTCLYGGAPKGPQLKEIERGVDIIVATPGRLNDILEMKKINFCQVSFLVLDEADRMLDMGFEPQIRKIVNEIPPRRQTLMYTATWPKEVRKIAGDLLVNPVQVNIGKVNELAANKSITQYVEVVLPMEKQRRVEQILRTQERGSKIIIFCSTKRLCDQLARSLGRGFGAAAIHGDKSQGERDYVLNQFRSGKAPILVATDVAARGLDIKDIRVVINYDFPTGVEDYVHRIGRTGRAGATGLAYTFISDQDWKHAADLVKVLEGANQRVPPEVREMAARGGPSFSRGRGGTSRWDSGGGRGMRDNGGFGRGMMDGNGGGRGGRDGGGGRRWDAEGGRGMRDGGGFGGRGGRNDFSSGGRGNRGRGFGGGLGGRGWQDRAPGRGPFDDRRGAMERHRDRSYSRSPERGRSWSYHSSDYSRSRSRSWSRSRSRSRSRSKSHDRYVRPRGPSGFDVPPVNPLPVVPPGQCPAPGGEGVMQLPGPDNAAARVPDPGVDVSQ